MTFTILSLIICGVRRGAFRPLLWISLSTSASFDILASSTGGLNKKARTVAGNDSLGEERILGNKKGRPFLSSLSLLQCPVASQEVLPVSTD
jgi:hypothetical protein